MSGASLGNRHGTLPGDSDTLNGIEREGGGRGYALAHMRRNNSLSCIGPNWAQHTLKGSDGSGAKDGGVRPVWWLWLAIHLAVPVGSKPVDCHYRDWGWTED